MAVGRRARRRRGVVLAAAAVSCTSLLTAGFTAPTQDAGTASPYPLVMPGHRTDTPAPPALSRRPNIVMITADDASILDMPYMPNVRRLIGERGVTFANSVAPTPICVPARASLLTGQYAHNHGALTISGPRGGWKSFRDRGTLPVWLRSAGYKTMFVGKYLNGYGEAPHRYYVPPGWNQWRATIGGSTYNFMDPIVNVNGHRLVHHHEYNSRLFARQSADLIAGQANSTQPFFMWVNYVAPHHGGPQEPGDPTQLYRGTSAALETTVPDPVDRGRYRNVPLPKRPDMFESDTSDKPGYSPAQHRFTATQKRALRKAFDQRIEAVRGVDRGVGRTIAALKAAHKLSNTVVIFTSDNGFVTGEHNIYGKLWQYNEIVRIPVLMAGPGIPRGKSVHTALTNPDIPVTIAAMARAKPTRNVDGIDMLPWLSAPTQRRVVPLEAWQVTDGSRPRIYDGVRVGPWTFVRYRNGREEVYNRTTDPYELHNLARVPAYDHIQAQLQAMSTRYRDCAGATCPQDLYR